MSRRLTRKEKALVQCWNGAVYNHPKKSTEFLMQMALYLYNNSNPNEPADTSDLVDALDKLGDE